jgi:hypothetical protein
MLISNTDITKDFIIMFLEYKKNSKSPKAKHRRLSLLFRNMEVNNRKKKPKVLKMIFSLTLRHGRWGGQVCMARTAISLS